ncbi:MAG: hypothetical protein GY757_59070 [bacterium]|nr:hypothetical protein [bacterium]
MKKATFIFVIIVIVLFFDLQADVSILVEENAGIARTSEPVTLGVPFAKGVLSTSSPVRIVNSSGSTMDSQFKRMALWGDGSIRWLKCDFQVDVSANSTATYTLKTDSSSTASTSLSVSESSSAITVTTGAIRFVVNKTGFNLIDEVRLDLNGNGEYAAGEEIITAGQSIGPIATESGTDYLASTQVPESIEIEEQGPMKVVIKVSGRYYNGSSYLLKYETRIYAYAGKPYIKLWHVFANGKSVPSLGDPLDPANGVSFDRCSLDFQLNLSGARTARFGGESGTVSVSLGSGQTATLLQRDRVANTEALYYSVKRNNTVLSSGVHAGGWGTVSDSQWGMTLSGRYFWQKYPKAIEFDYDGTASFEQAPSEEYLYVGMGSGDEILVYFHSAADAEQAGQVAQALNHAPLFPRVTAQQFAGSNAFYSLRAGTAPYTGMAGYIEDVTDNFLSNQELEGLYGTVNFGDSPVGYWYVVPEEIDATAWGNNYYDCNVLTPIRLFAQEGNPEYPNIFIPGARFFMETACWNTYDANDWMNGYCPAYSTYHRSTAHFQHHYGEGLWYYYYLTGDERALEVGLRAADSIINEQWWGNNNVDCRMAYQRGSVCLEAWRNTGDSTYLDHAKHLLIDVLLATQDNYGLIGSSWEGVVEGEQTFMMALYSDSLWKYIQELSPGSSERQQLTTKLALLADLFDTYARKEAGEEEYWNFFDAPSNAAPPQPVEDEDDPDATVYWFGKGLIAGTYAYAYQLTGESKYKTMAVNLLEHIWDANVIDWSESQLWAKASGQAMKNMIHAVAIVNEGSSPASIAVTSPNGGESWTAGSAQSITWSSTGSIASVDIDLSVNSGSSWSSVVSATNNDGSYSWTVPGSASSSCLIRVSGNGGSTSDSSDAVFSITSTSTESFTLNRSYLNFAGILSGSTTQYQTVTLTAGSGSLNWSATPGASWLSCYPVSGSGSQVVSVSVNTSGLSAGSYSSSLTFNAPSAVIPSRSVTVNLSVISSSQPPFGVFSTPLEGVTVEGSVPVTGWVLDDVEVSSVKIYNSDAYIGDAIFVEGARPDVEQAYPGYPLNYRAGWGYMLLTNFLPNQGNGSFVINAIATDSSGNSVSLGSATILCDNANAVKPFGAIDTPAQGGDASGSSFRNNGWALTPQPASIASDGSTIQVWVDGVSLGNPVYGLNRPDIETLMPGFANSSAAGGYLDIDTTLYANGVHTISWSVQDNSGSTEGIGSRYFSISNTGADALADVSGGFTLPVDTVGIDHRAVLVKTGFGINKGRFISPGKNRGINISIKMLERIEIDLGALPVVAGFQRVGGGLTPLPTGSTLDTQKGIFYWQPGPGFLGEFRLVFLSKNQEGVTIAKNINLKIRENKRK